MNTSVKIVRALWANKGSTRVFNEIPKIPTVKNQVVYVWQRDVEEYLIRLGYETRFVDDDYFIEENKTEYGRKLIALDLALKEFGEVLLLDWDCHFLRPFDDKFYNYLNEKPIQCPLYTQHVDTAKSLFETFDVINNPFLEYFEPYAIEIEKGFSKYSWKMDDCLIGPNFSCVYSRDVTFGEQLIKIAKENDIRGCVEEHAMWIYANCTLEEYLERYQPVFVQGVSDDRTDHEFKVSKVQRKVNQYISEKVNMDLYLKHI